MKAKISSKKGLKINLDVFIEKKTIKEKIDLRLVELSKTLNLKGFRPGKVPVEVLQRQFGKAVHGEVLENILKESTTRAIEENNIKPANQPKIDLKKYEEGKDLQYTIEIEQLPEIKIAKLNNIKVTNYQIEISQADVNQRLKDMAENQNDYGEKKENEIAKNGDLIVFDYEANINNEKIDLGESKNVQLILGKDLFIKGFDKQLIGSKKLDKKNVKVKLPKNYPKKELSNKEVEFFCNIKNIKMPIKTEINDKFAKNLGAKDLKNLKENISLQIKNEANNTLDSVNKMEILDQLENFQNFQIPETLIEQEISLLNADLKKEDLEKNREINLKTAKKRVKIGLILNEIGEQNKLKVTENEMKSEIEKQIQMMPGQAKQVIEFYQKNPAAASNLRGGIYEDKIIKLIKEKANISNKKLSLEEAKKIILNKSQSQEHKRKDVTKSKKEKSKKTSKSSKKK